MVDPVHLEMSASVKDLASFNLAIDSRLRAFDLVRAAHMGQAQSLAVKREPFVRYT